MCVYGCGCGCGWVWVGGCALARAWVGRRLADALTKTSPRIVSTLSALLSTDFRVSWLGHPMFTRFFGRTGLKRCFHVRRCKTFASVLPPVLCLSTQTFSVSDLRRSITNFDPILCRPNVRGGGCWACGTRDGLLRFDKDITVDGLALSIGGCYHRLFRIRRGGGIRNRFCHFCVPRPLPRQLSHRPSHNANLGWVGGLGGSTR
jgi:hypothetical protein